ncbi:MAG: WG repeat-containing protein [Clostridia bacterium]|nr:WG repeat-containing protein [Clostridia bacterium]
MKKVIKYIIISSALAILIIVFSVLMILYDLRLFDISFIKREDPVTETQTEAVTTGPEDTGEETGAGTETEDIGTDTEPAEETSDIYEKIHELIPAANGRILNATEDTYDRNTMTLYRLDNVTLPQSNASSGVKTRERYTVTKDGVLRTFTRTTLPEMRPAVDVYMGMFVVADGKKLSFYNGSGRLIYTYEGEKELVFAYERDKEDRPLFILDEKYWYIDEATSQLSESDFDVRDSRGLHYNYPSSFGKSDGQYVSYRSGDYHGVADADGRTVRTAIFEEGYNYSDGLGLISYKGDACYLNEAGKVAIDDFEIVVQRDEGGIGSIYFDGGYVIVRKIIYNPIKRTKVEEDMEVLIDTRGREYELPKGYNIVSYSDQRILVENNKKYGFYAVKGAWIADTVYTYATPYYEGLAVVGSNAAKGVIDLNGDFVIPMSYSYISVCSGGIIVCYSQQTGYEVYIKAEK